MIQYYKYYLEIKNRFFLLFFNWTFVSLICYLYKDIILFIIINSNSYYRIFDIKPYFIFTDVGEIFYVYLQLIFFVSNQILVIMTFYHILIFLSLGLYHSEYLKLQFTFKIFIISWICSIIFLNKVAIPFSWAFFLSFQKSEQILKPVSFFFEAKIIEYFNYFTSLYYICLINCQFFAIITLSLNNVSSKLGGIKKFRKMFYLIFVIFSTLTTPPDIISQVVMSISLILIYELLVLLKYLKINMVTS